MLPAVCNEICRRNDRQGVNPRDARRSSGAFAMEPSSDRTSQSPPALNMPASCIRSTVALCGTAVLQHAPRVGYPGEDVSPGMRRHAAVVACFVKALRVAARSGALVPVVVSPRTSMETRRLAARTPFRRPRSGSGGMDSSPVLWPVQAR